jgi:hypothetical protein
MKLFAILPLLFAGAASAQTPPPATIDGLPIGAIPTQAMPATGCAAFLWTASGTRALVAMAGADPAQLRLSIGGTLTDLPRTEQHDPGGFGFAGTTQYQAGDVTAVLTMSIVTRGDLKDGAAVPEATLRIDRTGQDSFIVPVAGLVGCAA